MDTRPIGIFDSGVGGLTVLKEIKKVLPNENYIYIGDTKRFPYGSKSKESIIQMSKRMIEYLIKQEVKVIVIACGTATSQALEEVKKIYATPIIGIIAPTVENQIQKDTKRVGVIATRGTIRSHAWTDAIKQKNAQIEVIAKETPLLASMAEEGWTQNEVAKQTIKEYMKELKQEKLEKLILGCTHYPLFKELIQQELTEKVEIINTGVEMAKFLQQYLQQNKRLNEQGEGTEKIYLTDIECNFVNVAEILLQEKIEIEELEEE